MHVSLGKVTVVTPGVPVRATSNETDPLVAFRVHAYVIQRREASTGTLYVSLSATDDRAALTKILAELTKGQPAYGAAISIAGNALNLAEIFIDADQAGSAVNISALVL
jgi:hypothetical protein